MILYPERAERISKIMSGCSICSRREAERLISEGRITLNGCVVSEPGTKAVAGRDKICLDGAELDLKAGGGGGYGYYLLNKPCGYLTTCSDPFGRKTIFDLIELDGHYFPAGRLDLNSRGLVFITNDGLLCDLIIHPRNRIEKVYMVKIGRPLDQQEEKLLENGVEFEGESYRALKVSADKRYKNGDTVYKVVLNEGKKREIRYMFKALGVAVKDLFRVRIANLSVEGVKEGSYRALTEGEIRELKEITGYEKESEKSKRKS